MAPEQLRGEAVDSAADQFSFCVSLYWALYDLYPFRGDAEQARANLLVGIVSGPPSDAKVPRWLRQVILRGLRPEPDQRHPSMKALLAALRADPIAVRRRRLRTTLLIASAAILAIAIAAGAFAYRARRAVTEQARLAQQFGQEVERIDAVARVAASLPLHDPRREMEVVRARMERLEERIAALGPMAIGPGHEALGRAHLARGSPAKALVELDAAAAAGYRSLELTQALGMAHGALYQRALGDGREGERAAQAHRDAALRYLREVEARARAGQAPAGVDGPEYVAALIALYEGRFADAVALAQKTAARARMPYEARTLEGDVHLAAARERSRHGDAAAALVELERAGTAYRSATESRAFGRRRMGRRVQSVARDSRDRGCTRPVAGSEREARARRLCRERDHAAGRPGTHRRGVERARASRQLPAQPRRRRQSGGGRRRPAKRRRAVIPKAPEAATPSTNDATGDVSTRPTLTRGTSIGRYLILDPVGEGGMGVVYKAYDPKLDRLVALKVMRTLDEGDGQRGRLLREAQALAQLSHPNVIAVHDVGTFGDDVFIAMELVGGVTVRQWLKAQPRTQREILDVFLAAGEGLAAAHRAGLVHRDFKPGNVMVGDDERVRVLDFGLARAAGTSSPRIDRARQPRQRPDGHAERGDGHRRRARQSQAGPAGAVARGARSLGIVGAGHEPVGPMAREPGDRRRCRCRHAALHGARAIPRRSDQRSDRRVQLLRVALLGAVRRLPVRWRRRRLSR